MNLRFLPNRKYNNWSMKKKNFILPVFLFKLDIKFTRFKRIIDSLTMSLSFPCIIFWHVFLTDFFKGNIIGDKDKYIIICHKLIWPMKDDYNM